MEMKKNILNVVGCSIAILSLHIYGFVGFLIAITVIGSGSYYLN